MARVLILFAHPALEKSRIHAALVRSVPPLPNLTFHDLYEAYPNFDVDIAHEQKLLIDHDLIVFQHPLFWYSTPPLMKQWIDLVLEHGWAYGSQGTALRGKQMLSLLSAGGGEAAYQHEGYNRFTLRELLAPIEQTAYLCGMDYLPPYVIHGTHRMSAEDIAAAAADYAHLLTALHDDAVDFDTIRDQETLTHVWKSAHKHEVTA